MNKAEHKRRKKVQTPAPLYLNAIIPDAWVAKAVAQSFKSPHKPFLYREDCELFWINSNPERDKSNGKGIFDPSQIFYNKMTMVDPWNLIWMHLIKIGADRTTQLKMEETLREIGRVGLIHVRI
jgi:hypothetical protein